MGRRVNRVRCYLDAKGIKSLPHEEIVAILRGADDLIMSGGRTLLAKLLKGSREKKLLELKLDENPSYGFYKELALADVQARIDWVILQRYMRIEYDYRLPLLAYTGKGWEIEKETFANELLQGFEGMLESGCSLFNMRYLKDRNRQIILLLLEKVEESRDQKYIPILKAWEKVDYKKVQIRIKQVIQSLGS